MKTKSIFIPCALLLSFVTLYGAHHAKSNGNCPDGLMVHYFATQEALAGDDLDAAQVAANQLLEAHKKEPCAQGVGRSAQDIGKAPSIKEARTAFKKLSDIIIPLVEEQGAGGGEAHLVHCPMAFNFTGASWLQKDQAVANPYFGSEMFACGSVKRSFGRAQKKE